MVAASSSPTNHDVVPGSAHDRYRRQPAPALASAARSTWATFNADDGSSMRVSRCSPPQALVPNQGRTALLPAGTDVTVQLPEVALRALPAEHDQVSSDEARAGTEVARRR